MTKPSSRFHQPLPSLGSTEGRAPQLSLSGGAVFGTHHPDRHCSPVLWPPTPCTSCGQWWVSNRAVGHDPEISTGCSLPLMPLYLCLCHFGRSVELSFNILHYRSPESFIYLFFYLMDTLRTFPVFCEQERCNERVSLSLLVHFCWNFSRGYT